MMAVVIFIILILFWHAMHRWWWCNVSIIWNQTLIFSQYHVLLPYIITPPDCRSIPRSNNRNIPLYNIRTRRSIRTMGLRLLRPQWSSTRHSRHPRQYIRLRNRRPCSINRRTFRSRRTTPRCNQRSGRFNRVGRSSKAILCRAKILGDGIGRESGGDFDWGV